MAPTKVDEKYVSFADGGTANGNTGHDVTGVNGTVAAVGDRDVLVVGSDTTVVTPTGFTLRSTFVGNQGGYAFERLCTGGESATVRVKTNGDFNTTAMLQRWRGTLALDVATNAHIDANGALSTPGVNTGLLATATELVIAGAVMTDVAGTGVAPGSPVWTAGYVADGGANIGVGAAMSAGFMAHKTPAGTAAETPSVSWTPDNMRNRYIFVLTFTTGADVTIQGGSGGVGSGSSPGMLANDQVIQGRSGGTGAGSSRGTVQTNVGVVHDEMVMPVLANALACLQTEANKVAAPPREYMIRPGATFTAMADSRYDECCGGIGWVRPGPFWESDTFPVQRAGVSHIQPAYYAVSVELGLMRCLPTKSNVPADGPDAKPTAAQWLSATQAEQDDGAALRRVVCCLRVIYRVDGVVAGQYNPLENEANCTGISVVITMRVPACDCVDVP